MAILSKNRSKWYIPALIGLFVLILLGQGAGEFLGGNVVFGYGGGIWRGPSLARIKKQSSFNTPLIVTNVQSGTLTRNMPSGNTFKIEVPRGSVAPKTTFLSAEEALNNNLGLTRTGASLIGGDIFSVRAIDSNRNFVIGSLKDLTITLGFVDFPSNTNNVAVYAFDNNRGLWKRITGVVFGENEVVFKVKKLGSFAVVKVVETPGLLDIGFPVAVLDTEKEIGEVLGAVTYYFKKNMTVGSRGTSVFEFQKRLTNEGVYRGPITGYFGPLTKAGAKRYQAKYGIIQTGFVGPLTRTQLNKGQVKGASTSMTIEALNKRIEELRNNVALLLERLAGVLGGN